MSNQIGIIDEPVSPGNDDKLDIKRHSKALTRFMEKTNTPITIGIQGEWGSGKTSLLNSIKHHFTQKDEFLQIWINAWESSLLSTPEESLLKIINEIIDELLSADKNASNKKKIQESAAKVFKGALRIGATAALGLKAGEVTEELLKTQENSIKALRTQLTHLVTDLKTRQTNRYENIIIYVDDLDRIEPKNAVAILELLKNIFSVPNCIFVLAIDYQVVVKGLEGKFGKQTAENEWEFRAFFDKIIQLPFMMPMGDYNISKYINSLLEQINFVDPGVELLDDAAVSNIVGNTIGQNPRSLKRLVNSVALLEDLREASQEEEGNEGKPLDKKQKLLLFSILCLQIEFPLIYSLLRGKPDFTAWDDTFAFRQTNRAEERLGDAKPEEMKDIFNTDFKAAMASEDFDEEWEQALFRICYTVPRLKARASNISKFLSYLKDELLDDAQSIENSIELIIDITSVTSVESTDQNQNLKISSKSKIFDGSQVSNLGDKKIDLITQLNKSGSKIYGMQKPKGHSSFMAFKSQEVKFENMPLLDPLWSYQFTTSIWVRLDGENADSHQGLLNYLEKNIPKLNNKFDKELGQWSVFNEASLRKGLYFSAPIGTILPISHKEITKTMKSGAAALGMYLIENPNLWDKIFAWGTKVVPTFEKSVIELLNKYTPEGGERIKSPKGYSSIGR